MKNIVLLVRKKVEKNLKRIEEINKAAINGLENIKKKYLRREKLDKFTLFDDSQSRWRLLDDERWKRRHLRMDSLAVHEHVDHVLREPLHQPFALHKRVHKPIFAARIGVAAIEQELS